MPHAVAEMCTAKERELASMNHGNAPPGKLAASDSFDLHDILLTGRVFAEPAKKSLMPTEAWRNAMGGEAQPEEKADHKRDPHHGVADMVI